MKKFILMLSLLVSVTAGAAEKTVTLSVPGMVCAVCPITVKKSLLEVKGVQSAEVSLKTKMASVRYDDAITNITALLTATKKAGYPSSVKK